MAGRGTKKRGRPPKVVVPERQKKFQYHLLKKPKYLQNQNKTSDSTASTPTASRASSPQGSDASRRSSVRPRGRKSNRRGGLAGSGYQRRGYNPNAADYHDSEYHYGSDFGDESSGKSDMEDEQLGSRTDSEDSLIGDPSSDSDFSLSSFSNLSGTPRKLNNLRPPSPEPLWLQNRELPLLELPKTSDDLMLPTNLIMNALSIYEVLRHFRQLVRLSPFRLEDFCASLACEDQSILLTEIHIMLLKALLREEDSQQTHFGPLDQKDSINITLFLIDNMTWPEVLRAYIESDSNFDQNVLTVLDNCEYPYTCVEDRLKVLQFLTDQFLITNPVREDLLSEGPVHYDDHCRICFRLGDLLCCETCPAVYHLECVEPPLVDVPTEDWQCSICKTHKLLGVLDCIPQIEKQGLLCRQEHLGYDRHGRKYWFLDRRIFIETEDGTELWYYSTVTQLDELLSRLDNRDMEMALCRELVDCKDEIVRQMEITESITNSLKGNKKSYLELENANVTKQQKERAEKLLRDEEEKERQDAEDSVARLHGEFVDTDIKTSETIRSTTTVKQRSSIDGPEENVTEVTTTTTTTTTTTVNRSVSESKTDAEDMDVDIESDCSLKDKGNANSKNIVTRSKTGSLTPRTFNMDDLKRKAGKDDQIDIDSPRLTRQKLSQINNGTYMFKLGMENTFKTFVNQFSTNPIALNKPQRHEERDKKRHLSHKFSLTPASEFKWIGNLNGTQALVVSTLRQTLLALEGSMQAAFMHPNWPIMRKSWITAVGTAVKPKDFSRAIIVIQSCMKSVVFASVWHEQLGHVKLRRITAAEREEKKKQDKREKREKDDEEERNKLTYNFVKYTLGLKHQVWKQKGEEYRIHGIWGWIWMSSARKNQRTRENRSLLDGPQKILVKVQDKETVKILNVEPKTYTFLLNKRNLENLDEKGDELKACSELKILPVLSKFDEIDVSKALTRPVRILYPKVARKSRLDDFLQRRLQLKALEEKKLSQTANKIESIKNEEDTHVDVENDIDEKPKVIVKPNPVVSNTEVLKSVAEQIQAIRLQFGNINRLAKPYKCYTRGCNANTLSQPPSQTTNCYSPLCMQKVKVRTELLALLRKAHVSTNNINNSKKTSILEQKLTEQKGEVKTESAKEEDIPVDKDLLSAYTSAELYDEDETLSCIVRVKRSLDSSTDSNVKDEKDGIKTEQENTVMDVNSKTEFDDNEQMNLSGGCNEIEVGSNEETSAVNTDPTAPDVKQEIDISVDSPPHKKIKSSAQINENDNLKIDSVRPERPCEFLGIHYKKPVVKTRMSTRGRPPKSSTAYTTTQVSTTTTTTTSQTVRIVDGVVQTLHGSSSYNTENKIKHTNVANGIGKSMQTSNSSSSYSTYHARLNRRFCTTKTLRREENTVKAEFGVDGTEKVYSAVSAHGKVYLKKIVLVPADRKRKSNPVKYPLVATFQTRNKTKTLMALPQHDLKKLARLAGRIYVSGYHHMAKANMSMWPYPCSRPLFKTCWLYRTVHLRSLAAVALQLRIIWACLKWDDMALKPANNDGKHQVTTETEIMSLELLKHRHVGKFMEKTQYLRRRVVIPLELPKTIREVTSIRSGLRKRKRAESPQHTEPQVTEEWVDEDKLELWEIKQYGEKLEKANALPVTRTATGKLPPTKLNTDSSTTLPGVRKLVDTVSGKATPEEIKEKMEQQLRMQRAAHQQKRALEMKGVKIIPQISQGSDGSMRIVSKVPIGQAGKSSLTSLLTGTATPGKSSVASRRVIMTKAANNNVTKTGKVDNPQKVQIIRQADGKIQVRGLMAGQQVVQMPDGRIHVLTGNQQIRPAVVSSSPSSTSTSKSAPTIKAVVRPSTPNTPKQIAAQSTAVKTPKPSTVVIRQQTPTNNPTLQKVTTPTVVVSGGQVITGNTQTIQGQKIIGQQIVPGSQIVGPGQQILQTSSGQKIVVSKGLLQGQKIVVTPGQQVIGSQQQLVAVSGGQKIVMGAAGQQIIQTQNGQQLVAVTGQQLVAGQRLIQTGTQQIVVSCNQVVAASPTQVIQTGPRITQQIVVSNPSLVQQLSMGKVQMATIGGQQVLIRSTGNNQAQIVAQITGGQIIQPVQNNIALQQAVQVSAQVTQNSSQVIQHVQNPQGVLVQTVNTAQVPVSSTGIISSIKQSQVIEPQPETAHTPQSVGITQQPQQTQLTAATVAPVPNPPQPENAKTVPQIQTIQPDSKQSNIEQSLLIGQPPGTVIKCVTAQVITTPQGPRIVLQGLQGTDFTPQQLAMVQQQVKQQLLKAQETTGKQGVLGPTKIYLAVQPVQPVQPVQAAQPAQPSVAAAPQPPPLAPVQQIEAPAVQQVAVPQIQMQQVYYQYFNGLNQSLN